MSNTTTPRILSRIKGINAKVVATTTLYTVQTGKTAIITGAIIRCSTATAVTVRPKLGIGIAAGEDDIFASTNLIGFTTVTSIYSFVNTGTTRNAVAGSVIKLGIDNGSTATTHTIEVDLIGYLI